MTNSSPQISAKDTTSILTTMWDPRIKDDLYKWVMYSFKWGAKNTPLANYEGPRQWQADELNRMTDFIGENKLLAKKALPPKVYKSATTSGRGPGKSALVSWLTLWQMSCNLGSNVILSANTETQLTSITFGEIGKWLALCLSGHCFDKSSVKLSPKPWFVEQVKRAKGIDESKYYAIGKLWNEDNPDAFAGEHNSEGMMLIFDEASGIPQPIWSVSDGFFTDLSVYRFWFVFSNPRRNTGPFFECFHRHRDYWFTRQIDSRSVEGLDHAQLNEIIHKYGEDSDNSRVEVKGEFPRQGDNQFIAREIVTQAQTRELEGYDDHAALLMGVDPARYGDDSTVIRFRRGRDARSIPAVTMKGADNMQVANKVAELIEKFNPDAVFVDSGSGAGIIDRLRERGYKIHEVGFGTASEDDSYADHRTELWGRMRDWLGGAMIDNDSKLADDFCGPEYFYYGAGDKIRLEPKEKMKKRGLASPDQADALAVTFHAKIARKDLTAARDNVHRRSRLAKGLGYKVFDR